MNVNLDETIKHINDIQKLSISNSLGDVFTYESTGCVKLIYMDTNDLIYGTILNISHLWNKFGESVQIGEQPMGPNYKSWDLTPTWEWYKNDINDYVVEYDNNRYLIESVDYSDRQFVKFKLIGFNKYVYLSEISKVFCICEEDSNVS